LAFLLARVNRRRLRRQSKVVSPGCLRCAERLGGQALGIVDLRIEEVVVAGYAGVGHDFLLSISCPSGRRGASSPTGFCISAGQYLNETFSACLDELPR